MFASAVLDEAAALLNDQAKGTYNYTNMLPYLSKANDEFETQLGLNGISVLKQFSAVATIAIGTVLFPLPVDLLVPSEMFERLAGTTDVFLPMTPKSTEPEELASTNLKFWTYRNLLIYLGPANNAGALTARECKLIYTRLLTSITSSGSIVEVNKSKTYLAERTAGLAARFIGENDTRADDLDVMSRGPNKDGNGGSLGEVVQLYVRNNQSFGVRRKGYHRHR